MIRAVAARYGVPERLVTAVIHAESGSTRGPSRTEAPVG